ncbi:membrane cofactor protein isoform X4 [Astyanax mexicanus]|uniref:membrane cofactor protein isoform X4 n=1 Tax=Astyanax mexicanus TaxID=7994 RepID=UPI0020CB2992|nr:membrane cofactor protein isoform X4 [Astyanax mexicanus]
MVSKVECSSVIILLICLLKIENIRAQCTKPSFGENRVLTPESDSKESFPEGSTAEFQCATGYVTANPGASKTVTCTGGTWSDLALQCKKRSCGPLRDIPFGRYTYSPEGDEGLLFGAQATPECDKGYELTGKTRTCTVKGWDDRDATCEEVNCEPPPPTVPENGKPTEPLEDVYKYQTVITYSCNEGYVLSGHDSISCLETGQFETPPKCIKLSCGVLEVDPNAMTTGARPPYSLGSLVTFVCKTGFTMEGASELKCVESGWSSSPPRCIELQTTTTTTTTREPAPKITMPTTKDNSQNKATPSPNSGVKIGLGVGIPLCILALVVGVWYYKKRSSARGYSGNVAKSEDGAL